MPNRNGRSTVMDQLRKKTRVEALELRCKALEQDLALLRSAQGDMSRGGSAQDKLLRALVKTLLDQGAIEAKTFEVNCKALGLVIELEDEAEGEETTEADGGSA